MTPTKMLMTSTCFQQIASPLVHITFSLCMIIPQSFQFVGQIVRLSCSPQNVFQMTHLQMVREIVSDTTVVHRKFWAALGRRRTITRDEQWFQQDEATPHTSNNTLFLAKAVIRESIHSSAGGVTLSGRHTHPILSLIHI